MQAKAIKAIIMIDAVDEETQSLLRLMTWLTPSFPTGAFAYSAGLESAYATRLIKNVDDLQNWLETMLSSGAWRNEAILCAATWRDVNRAEELAELALSLATCRERFVETNEQGRSFVEASRPWSKDLTFPDPCPLPVCVGLVARGAKINLNWTIAAYLHSLVSNTVQAALRLGRIGQSESVKLLASLETLLQSLTEGAVELDIADLGASTFIADIVSMQHETLEPRIFRS